MFDIYDRSRTVALGGLSLVTTDNGPEGGIPVLMIHGWPDTARLWRNQAYALADLGYRVLAPDLRGRGRSDRPPDVAGYRVGKSVGDMIGILDEAGIRQAHVVAHDWGAAVGWVMAMQHPDRVRSLTALSVGHPAAFRSVGLEQTMRSWYMLLFQFEDIAERWLAQDDWKMFRRMVGDHPETEAWIEELSGEGALTASLNWYRANAHPRSFLTPPRPPIPCRVPTLGLWSSGDFALTERQMERSADHIHGEWRYERIEGCTHWIPLDVPDRLNQLLAEWLAGR